VFCAQRGETALQKLMHARYYAPVQGRFLSPDPVISKAAIRSPQLWNRYAYVGNNPIRFVDPDGRLLQLSGCVKDQSSDACKAQFNAYVSTFGKQSADAAKYLQVGKNGIVGFKGMAGAIFAMKFGVMGMATNYLVSNRAATFTMTLGRNAMTDSHNGGYCDCYGKADKTFGIDPARFPRMIAGANVDATEALVHEIGHGVASLFEGFAYSVGQRKARSPLMAEYDGNYEGYATSFENAWRHSVAGLSDARTGYSVANDLYDASVADITPP
jgi:RHS repeat-associated protein